MATKEKKGGTKPKSKSGIPLTPASKPPKGTVSEKKKTSDTVPVTETGTEKARKNRLKRAGIETDKCSVTGLPLEIGPRAKYWLTPVELHGKVISRIALAIIESGISATKIKKVAEFMSKMI